jgi:hypothetical protein
MLPRLLRFRFAALLKPRQNFFFGINRGRIQDCVFSHQHEFCTIKLASNKKSGKPESLPPAM